MVSSSHISLVDTHRLPMNHNHGLSDKHKSEGDRELLRKSFVLIF